MLRKLSLLLKTTAARLSALYLLLFSVCAVILVVYMTSLSVRMLTAQTQETIDEEAEGPAEIVGEAAAELDDEDMDEEEPAPAAIEELDEDSTEPLPDWKVVAWTELVATLYRPQDR